GHNEVRESRLNPHSQEPFWLRRIRSQVYYGGIARLLRPLLEAPSDGAPAPGPRLGKDPTEEFALLAGYGQLTRREWKPVAGRYRRNLEVLSQGANQAQVPLALVIPIGSLMHPGALGKTANQGDLPPELAKAKTDQHRSQRQVELLLSEDKDLTGAMEVAQQLHERYPTLGPPLALRAEVLADMGHVDAAVTDWKSSIALDFNPVRVGEEHVRIIQKVGQAQGIPVVDPEPSFLADPRYLERGVLFMDQTHPTIDGNKLLSAIIVASLQDLFPQNTVFDPRRVAVQEPSTDKERGWRLLSSDH
ncbi:MAG: hypothetical protein QGG40_02430, partial [Myxococcota bacterium]|nr:hypothetical protein [Myxococcota bacterium]